VDNFAVVPLGQKKSPRVRYKLEIGLE
jgi:hypothetical protein